MRDVLASSDFRQPEPKETRIEDDLANKPADEVLVEVVRPEIEVLRGAALCQEIRSMPTGKLHARSFEVKVTNALKYIFDKDLAAWSSQKATDTTIRHTSM